MKVFLIGAGIALAVLLLTGGRPDSDQPPLISTVVLPAEVGQLDTMSPAVTGVPLSISETTQPPGWEPPPALMPEQEIAAWLGELWSDYGAGLGGALVAVAILAALVVAGERSRYP